MVRIFEHVTEKMQGLILIGIGVAFLIHLFGSTGVTFVVTISALVLIAWGLYILGGKQLYMSMFNKGKSAVHAAENMFHKDGHKK